MENKEINLNKMENEVLSGSLNGVTINNTPKWGNKNEYWYNISIAHDGDIIPTNYDGETWISVRNNKKINDYILQAIRNTDSKIGVDGICNVTCDYSDHEYYIAAFYGGLNGRGEWKDYLRDISSIIDNLKDSYIIKLDNDCCDDVWYLTVGFSYPNE